MRFRLRNLLIWTTIGPPLLAAAWWIVPHALPFAAILYFAVATLYFAAWWLTICRDVEEATHRRLRSTNGAATDDLTGAGKIADA